MTYQRPKLHFTPPVNFMNDPNGLICYDGEYHLFYQSHRTPTGCLDGIKWGHAVSRDLIHWQHLPVVLPAEYCDTEMVSMFSGTAVIDHQNVSGLGSVSNPPFLVFYTGMHICRTGDYHEWAPKIQTVDVAYSLDHGRTFIKYHGNPLLDMQDRKFGDEKVMYHAASKQWLMVCIRGMIEGCAVFYGSQNLLDWAKLSEFRQLDLFESKYECPDFFLLPVDNDPDNLKHILKLNGAPHAAADSPSHSYFIIGDFDGTAFHPDTQIPSRLCIDYGTLYAEQTFSNISASDGRTIYIGWISHESDPENRNWTGFQSLPRTLTLTSTAAGYQILQNPVEELRCVRGPQITIESTSITDTLTIPNLTAQQSRCLEIELEFTLQSSSSLGLKIPIPNQPDFTIIYHPDQQQVTLNAGSREFFAPVSPSLSTLKLHLIIDAPIVELFINDGAAVITAVNESLSQCQPPQLAAASACAQLLYLHAWPLKLSF